MRKPSFEFLERLLRCWVAPDVVGILLLLTLVSAISSVRASSLCSLKFDVGEGGVGVGYQFADVKRLGERSFLLFYFGEVEDGDELPARVVRKFWISAPSVLV